MARRNEWLHKLAAHLSNACLVVVTEGMQTGTMTADAANTTPTPDRRVRKKKALHCFPRGQGGAEIQQQSEYEMVERGGAVLAVLTAFASQTCYRRCRYLSANAQPGLTVFNFRCKACKGADRRRWKHFFARCAVQAARRSAYANGQRLRQPREGRTSCCNQARAPGEDDGL